MKSKQKKGTLVPRFIRRLIYSDPYKISNDRLQSIFIHIPKCAGISIEKSIFNEKVGHHRAKEYIDFDEKKFNSYWKFTVVRNPYDRLVSAYHFLKEGGRNEMDRLWSEKNLCHYQSFEEFVLCLQDDKVLKRIMRKPHFVPQVDYLIDRKGKIRVDYILHLESINEEIEVVKEHIGKNITLKHLNKSNRKHYENYYTSKTKSIIFDVYRDDFDMLDYDK